MDVYDLNVLVLLKNNLKCNIDHFLPNEFVKRELIGTWFLYGMEIKSSFFNDIK